MVSMARVLALLCLLVLAVEARKRGHKSLAKVELAPLSRHADSEFRFASTSASGAFPYEGGARVAQSDFVSVVCNAAGTHRQRWVGAAARCAKRWHVFMASPTVVNDFIDTQLTDDTVTTYGADCHKPSLSDEPFTIVTCHDAAAGADLNDCGTVAGNNVNAYVSKYPHYIAGRATTANDPIWGELCDGEVPDALEANRGALAFHGPFVVAPKGVHAAILAAPTFQAKHLLANWEPSGGFCHAKNVIRKTGQKPGDCLKTFYGLALDSTYKKGLEALAVATANGVKGSYSIPGWAGAYVVRCTCTSNNCAADANICGEGDTFAAPAVSLHPVRVAWSVDPAEESDFLKITDVDFPLGLEFA